MYIDRRRSGLVSFHPQFAGRHDAPMPIGPGNRIKVTIVVDYESVEAFGNNGLAAITSLIFPGAGDEAVSLFAEHGSVKLVRFNALVVPGP